MALPDGSGLSESAAILIHLDVAHPAAGLLPRDESARAQAIRGLVFIAANCYSAITVLDFPERFYQDIDDSARDHLRAGTKARLHRHWEIFADMFPARPFLAGNDIGALDLYAAVVTKWSGSRAHLAEHRRTVSRGAAQGRNASESGCRVRAQLAGQIRQARTRTRTQMRTQVRTQEQARARTQAQ